MCIRDRCSQEWLCWHGPDHTRRHSSCSRQRRLETIYSKASVACPSRSIAKALSQVNRSQDLSALEVCSRRGAIQIHLYLYLYQGDVPGVLQQGECPDLTIAPFHLFIYLFIYYESRTKVHIKNKNYAGLVHAPGYLSPLILNLPLYCTTHLRNQNVYLYDKHSSSSDSSLLPVGKHVLRVDLHCRTVWRRRW